MKTMWRAKFGEIQPCEVIKETDKQVMFLDSDGNEQREAKVSDWGSWHNTKEEAKNYLIEKYRKTISSRQMDIDSLKSKIKNIEQL